MKHYLVTIAYSRPGQHGVQRMKKEYREKATSPGTAINRVMKKYKEVTHGKHNLSYYIMCVPLCNAL